MCTDLVRLPTRLPAIPHGMARATKLLVWMIPGEARVFPVDELEQAKAWVVGDPYGQDPSLGGRVPLAWAWPDRDVAA
jgi:hypothetical protein